jgi:hypothetical protein
MEITDLTSERLAIGEGDRDYQFLLNLAANRGITAFQFGNVQGSSTFSLLRKLSILPRFDKVSTLLIFGDNDEEAGKTFQTIKDGLNEAGLASPAHPLQVTRKQKSPPVAVVMMPFPEVNGDTQGCLETLLIPAIVRAHPAQAGCVDTMFTCVGANNWRTKSSRDKLLVRSILSASCESNPMCGHPEWYRASSNLIPLEDPIFNGVAELLANAPAWFDSGTEKWEDWKAANLP